MTSAIALKFFQLNPRIAFALPAIACAGLLGFGYYLQYGPQQLNPCPLCLVQRGFYYAVIATGLLAAIHGPGPRGQTVYGLVMALFALGGASVAARQTWLQHLPPDQVPQCGPDLFFMLENLPIVTTVKKLFTGTGECAVVDWTFLGFSIAEWSLVCFSGLVVYAAWLAFRSKPAAA